MKNIYKFWSIFDKDKRGWLCIPPQEKYIPDWYPKNALVKKHEEELLPPQNYWLKPEYEDIVYSKANGN